MKVITVDKLPRRSSPSSIKSALRKAMDKEDTEAISLLKDFLKRITEKYQK